MKWLILICFILCWIFSCSKAQVFYVAAPNTLRLDSPETIAIALDGPNSALVHVYVQDHPGKIKNISLTQVEVRPSTPKLFKIHLKPEDFPDNFFSILNQQNFVVLIVHSGNFHKELVIPITIKTGYVFIQTDKPIYSPKQLVNFRIISLNEDALPSEKEFKLQIKNPKNVLVEETIFNNIPHLAKKSFTNHVYKFPTYPITGYWSATVLYGFKMLQNTTIHFELQEYVLPTFEIEIDTQDVILPNNNFITTTVKAKYVYGKNVQGSVTFKFGVKGEAPEIVFFAIIGPRELTDGSYTLHLNTSNIKNHKDIGWFPEIEKSHLIVEATVMDAASGNREVKMDSKAQFSKSPYTISFKRCLQDFKPGLMSVFEADINYVAGRPAPGVPTHITALANGEPLDIDEPNALSDENGKVSFKIHPQMQHNDITIQLETQDPKYQNNQASGKFIQRKFSSTHNGYIALDRTTGRPLKPLDIFDKTVHVEPATEISDIYYMVTSKGRIITMEKLRHGLFKVQSFNFRITYEMVPEFRVVVFAHHQNELIADSLKVEVENQCHTNAEVNIETQFENKEPGNNGKFVITGSKDTLVGLLGVDEAVYALSKKDLLTKSKMFKRFASHDLGCGPGGGLQTDSVLRNAGIVVTTSIYSPAFKNHGSACEENVRRKRDAISLKLSNYEGLAKECCSLGMNHDTRSCEERTNIVVRYLQGRYLKCSRAFLDCCLYAKENGIDEMKLARSGISFQRGRVKDIDIEDAFVPIEEESFWESELTVRHDFRETWFTENIIIGADQREELLISLPHSITTWVVQAVSVSPSYGMCIAEPQKIISFKKVFVQLNLPYSVVRNEQIEVQATVFNYGDKTMSSIVYMYGVKDLCTGIREGEKSERKRLIIERHSGKSVAFPIIPLKEGSYDIKVIALSTDGSDIVQKKLNVIPEGTPEEINIPITLDPSNQQRRRKRYIESEYFTDALDESQNLQVTQIKLNLPNDFVPGTESCTISALGDQFGPVVETAINNPENLLLKPRGCGEQNMIFLAPTLYTMRYLKVTGRITAESEEKGYGYIRHGYGNQLTFRKDDGSYSAWASKPTSTWLTAFVAKIFCQANELVHIDKDVMCSAVKWLVDNQQPDGSFIESHPVYHKDMMGGVDGKVPMTAFTLIALEECKCDIDNMHISKARAMSFLEEHLGEVSKPLSVAIVAYALALSDSELKQAANDKLIALSKRDLDTNMLYWSTESSTRDIEATSYALLTQLLFNDLINGNSIVNWLNTKRLASGSFPSTQDTVIALQALSEYAIRAQTPGINLIANITSNNDRHFQQTMAFHQNNALVLQTLKVDNIGGRLFISTGGHGVGLLNVKLRYNLPRPEKVCKFDVTVNVSDTKEDLHRVPLRLDPRGKDVFHMLPNDLIRGVENALNVPEEGPELIADPRNRGNKFSRIGLPPIVNDRAGRVKRQDNLENSNRRIKIQICAKYLGNQDAGMSIIDAGIFTGFNPEISDLEELQNNPMGLIQKYEVYSKGVVFYLEKVPIQEKFCFHFHTTRDFQVGNPQASIIKVYDYYNPSETCTVFYSPNNNSPILKKICDNGICQCAEGGCPPQNPFAEVKGLEQKKMRKKLGEFACDENDYVWKGKLAGEIKKRGGFLEIPFAIEEVVKEGIEEAANLEGDTRLLLARDNCETAELFPEIEYLIMGRDGQKYQNDKEETWYRYILDNTSSIHMWTSLKFSSDKPLQRALNDVVKTLMNKGCKFENIGS